LTGAKYSAFLTDHLAWLEFIRDRRCSLFCIAFISHIANAMYTVNVISPNKEHM